MSVFEALSLQPGITAIIGSGGKTSLLMRLADEAPGTVALATTTHLYPICGIPLVLGDEGAVSKARARSRIVCAGSVSKQGKISAPSFPLARLVELFDFVIVEADGSKQLPLKAHADWEPVVPAEANRTVLVMGAVGFGQPVSVAAHRPELFCTRACCEPESLATPQLALKVVQAERDLGLIRPDVIFVNEGAASSHRAAKPELVFPEIDLPIITYHLERPRQEPLETDI